MRWLFAAAVLSGFGCPGLRAEAPLQVVHRSIQDGLSQSSVQAIVQDRTGYIWIATEDGLDRFDGYDFRVLRHDASDPRSLLDNLVSALFTDSQGRLWVGTHRGLSRYDAPSDSFTAYPEIHDEVRAIAETSDGTLYVASYGGGLSVLPKGATAFGTYVPDPRFPNDSLGSFALTALFVDHAGQLWIGTADHGIDRFVPGKPYGRFVHYRHDPAEARSLGGVSVWGIAEDPRGRLLVTFHGAGLDVLGAGGDGFEHVTRESGRSVTDDLTICRTDSSGACWVGSDGLGLLRFDPDKLALVSANDGPRVIRSLSEDAQGHLWAGTYQDGIYELRSARKGFAFFSSSGAVASLLEDHSGRIWAGTERGVVAELDPASGLSHETVLPAVDGTPPPVLAMHEDAQRRIWLGTYNGGLAHFDPAARSARFVGVAGAPQIWAIADAGDNQLWLGSDDGLIRFNPESGAVVSRLGAGGNNHAMALSVRALLRGRHGMLWVGSYGGLDALRPDAANFEHFQDGTSDAIYALHEDGSGRIWAGTLASGLKLFDPQTRRFSSIAGYANATIYAIAEQPAGVLWLSTNSGLLRFDIASGAFARFDTTNGLQTSQFHLGAAAHLRAGSMVFGSVDGATVFDPARIEPDRFAPPVVVTDARLVGRTSIAGRHVNVSGPIEFTGADRLLSLHFAALDYNFPKRNRYAYAIDGLTHGWVDLGNERDVTITDPPPGHYRFSIRASNSDGVQLPGSEASIALVVPPPFWATWWFRLAGAAALAALTYAAHRRHVRRLYQDLERRREMEQVLRSAEEKYRELVEDIGEAIFSADPEGRITYVSPVIEELIGCRRAELIGASLERIVGPREMAEIRTVAQAAERSTTLFSENELRAEGSAGKWVRVSTRILHHGGRVTGLRGVITDITGLKRLEAQVRQSQKMDAVGQLAGGIAHDFNNLLTAIIGCSDLLLEEGGTAEDYAAGLRDIRNASQRAATLTRQLLAFSRQQALQPQVVDLNVLLLEMEKMLQRLISENIMLAIALKPGSAVVRVDPGQVQQIVLNLAINARDAMPQGGRLLIQTGAQTSPEGASEIVLTVADSGTGMPPEVQARLFEPFFTTKGPGKGTGLGLSTVYGIVQQSEGRMDVESTVGKGSIFRVFFPQAVAPTSSGMDEPQSPKTLPPGTMLVVEDNESVAAVLRRLLARAGGQMLFASSAEEALEICSSHGSPIDLLLTDVVMPGRSGRELAEELKARYPRMKVVFMSGYADDVISQQGPFNREHRFLQKPFTQETLFRELQAALRI